MLGKLFFASLAMAAVGSFIGHRASSKEMKTYDQELILDQFTWGVVFSEVYGYDAKYHAKSHRRIEVVCPSIPSNGTNPGCFAGKVLTIDDGPSKIHLNYCQNETLQYISQSNEINITFSRSNIDEVKIIKCNVMPYKCEEVCTCPDKDGVYPMMAKLTDIGQSGYSCAATIINPIQVITAAHCVADRIISNLRVHVIRFDEALNATVAHSCSVDTIKVHENYNPSSYGYNIAIVNIHLSCKIEFSDAIYPVNLATEEREIPSGDYVQVLGWGSGKDANPSSSFIQQALVNIVDDIESKILYPGLTDGHSCTSLAPSSFCCANSGGGPVLWKNPENGKTVQIGIVDHQTPCCIDQRIAFVRIDQFTDWILQNIDLYGYPSTKPCRF